MMAARLAIIFTVLTFFKTCVEHSVPKIWTDPDEEVKEVTLHTLLHLCAVVRSIFMSRCAGPDREEAEGEAR